MPEPWKVIVCNSEQCLAEALESDGSVKKEYKIYPEVDTLELTRFKCPRCGQTEDWGPTRQDVARILYDRIGQGASR